MLNLLQLLFFLPASSQWKQIRLSVWRAKIGYVHEIQARKRNTVYGTDLQPFRYGSLRFAGLFESKTRQLCELLELGKRHCSSEQLIHSNTCFSSICHHTLMT